MFVVNDKVDAKCFACFTEIIINHTCHGIGISRERTSIEYCRFQTPPPRTCHSFLNLITICDRVAGKNFCIKVLLTFQIYICLLKIEWH